MLEELKRVSQFADVTLASIYHETGDIVKVSHLNAWVEEIVLAKGLRQIPPNIAHLPKMIANFTTPNMFKALADLRARKSFDLIHLHQIFLGEYVTQFGNLPIILEEHNIESDIFERAGNTKEFANLKSYEQAKWQEMTHCIAVTERDVNRIAAQVGENCVTLMPNGVDTDFFTHRATQDVVRIVFLGTLTYQPNLDAIRLFWQDVWQDVRQTGVEWLIMGSGEAKELDFLAADTQVKVMSNVPDIRDYLGTNSILVVPLRIGGGSRLKVLTGLAMECPIVSTSIGCEGLDVCNGEHLLVADRPEEFAAQIRMLLTSESLRQQLGKNGREFVVSEYSWDKTLAPLKEVYQQVLNCKF
jgi:glycosyltransferase involved in cell wall biosynthesis